MVVVAPVEAVFEPHRNEREVGGGVFERYGRNLRGGKPQDGASRVDGFGQRHFAAVAGHAHGVDARRRVIGSDVADAERNQPAVSADENRAVRRDEQRVLVDHLQRHFVAGLLGQEPFGRAVQHADAVARGDEEAAAREFLDAAYLVAREVVYPLETVFVGIEQIDGVVFGADPDAAGAVLVEVRDRAVAVGHIFGSEPVRGHFFRSRVVAVQQRFVARPVERAPVARQTQVAHCVGVQDTRKARKTAAFGVEKPQSGVRGEQQPVVPPQDLPHDARFGLVRTGGRQVLAQAALPFVVPEQPAHVRAQPQRTARRVVTETFNVVVGRSARRAVGQVPHLLPTPRRAVVVAESASFGRDVEVAVGVFGDAADDRRTQSGRRVVRNGVFAVDAALGVETVEPSK